MCEHLVVSVSACVCVVLSSVSSCGGLYIPPALAKILVSTNTQWCLLLVDVVAVCSTRPRPCSDVVGNCVVVSLMCCGGAWAVVNVSGLFVPLDSMQL